MSDIDYSRLMSCIQKAITIGMRHGFEKPEPSVLFRKWGTIPTEDLKLGQSPGLQGWSKDQYDGVLLDLQSSISPDEDVFTIALIQQLDGTIQSICVSDESITIIK